MTKKIIRLTPDQMGYQDRGKMKWQGLMLSDHTEAINKKSFLEKKQYVLPKPQLSLEDIGRKLALAYQKKLPIYLQTNTREEDSSFIEYHCLVAGNGDNMIYFSLINGQLIKTPIKNIRYLELLDSSIWQRLK